MLIRLAPCLLVLPALALATACGGGPTEPPDGPGVVRVTLTSSLRFSPADVSIDPGMTIRWVNGTSLFHTITPNDVAQPGVWARATTSSQGTVLTHTFTQAGRTYTYFCESHLADGMTGVIRVR